MAITAEYCNITAEFQQITSESLNSIFSLIQQYKGMRILIVDEAFPNIWQQVYESKEKAALKD
jgi:hypothetical protein